MNVSSETASHHATHRRSKGPAGNLVESDVFVNNGVRCNYYDKQREVYRGKFATNDDFLSRSRITCLTAAALQKFSVFGWANLRMHVRALHSGLLHVQASNCDI